MTIVITAEKPKTRRKKLSKRMRAEYLLANPFLIQRELFRRSYYEFFKYFWDVVSEEKLIDNWHIEYLCDELQDVAERVANKEKAEDLLINIPPGMTKTTLALRLFPAWCWTRWYWMKFITASYSQTLALESAEDCRDLIRSDKFKEVYPELEIKQDKDTKSNYKIVKRCRGNYNRYGGNRYSTSVGGSTTGFHCHIFIWDDPLNPEQETSETIVRTTNNWIDKVPSTRKVDKEVSTTIGIMQKLVENDPSGHWLAKKKKNLKHICLPGELEGYEGLVKPAELKNFYEDGLLDPKRLSRPILKNLLEDLGQYAYAGQIGQKPTPPGGGMFKVDNIQIIDTIPNPHYFLEEVVRYWDKAGSDGKGAYTAGVKIAKLKDGRFLIMDSTRGQWGTDVREKKILQTTKADDLLQTKIKEKLSVKIYVEQEPGSGGKESAEMTIRRLAGFNVFRDLPKGDKVKRADPFSVQVNEGNVLMLRGEWNSEYIKELEFFPYGKYKDQVDASAGAFAKLTKKRRAKSY